MTERRGDQGFSVAPRRIGDAPGDPGRGRLRRVGVAVVVATAAAIFTIAWLGPRLSGRPSLELSFFATPTPSATPTPTDSPDPVGVGPPLPTPLPAITRPDGAGASGRIAIETQGFRVLDLATGEVVAGPDAEYGRDAVFRSPDGDGWICVCFTDGTVDARHARTVRIIRIGATGAHADAVDVATIEAGDPDGRDSPDLLTDVDVRDDGRRGLLATASRAGDVWRLSVATLDLDRRSLGPATELGVATLPLALPSSGPSTGPSPEVPPPAQSPDVYLDGPHVRLAPDGRIAFVWGVLQRSTENGIDASEVHAWRLALAADGSVSEVSEAPGFDGLPLYCGSVAFATADRLAWFCPRFSPDGFGNTPPPWKLATIDLAGRSAGARSVPPSDQGFFGEPMFDHANGQVYAWDPIGLTIARIDVRSLDVATVTFDPAATVASGIAPGGGTARPHWRDADSAIQMLGFGQLAGAPDGSRIYAVGYRANAVDSGMQASLGIFSLDRSTLALIGRWAPAADYLSVSVTDGGDVAAVGMPNADEHGREAPWEGSLTIHDPADGRILVRFGQLGTDMPPLVVDR